MGLCTQKITHAHQIEGSLNNFSPLLFRNSPYLKAEFQVFIHRGGKKDRTLLDHNNLTAQRGQIISGKNNLSIIIPDPTCGRRRKETEDFEKCGLSGSVRP